MMFKTFDIFKMLIGLLVNDFNFKRTAAHDFPVSSKNNITDNYTLMFVERIETI